MGSDPAGWAERRAAREIVAAFRQEQLPGLLDHLRDGFAQLDAGEIDESELDELVHRYKKAAAKLWALCGSGRATVATARAIAHMREQGLPAREWWDDASPQRPTTAPS